MSPARATMDGVRRRAVVLSLVTAGLVAAVVTSSLDRPAPSADLPRTETGTAAPSSTTRVTPATTATPAPSPLPEAERAALATAVTNAVGDIAPGTELGLAVYDRLTESYVARVNADRPFYTASVVKLLIVTDRLRESGWRLPDGELRTQIVAMLRESTDWIAQTLWDDGGGPAIDTRMAEHMGLSQTHPPNDADQWELTRMSARDVVTVYRYLLDRMPSPANAFVLDALRTATPEGADGFDQTFGLRSAFPEATRAIKQGWMRVDAGLVLNTTGLVGDGDRYVVVLLALLPHGTGFDDGRKAVTAGVAALDRAMTAETD